MPWFKVDDTLYGHPKWLAAPPAARALWVAAGSWCGAQANDGHVPRHALVMFGARPRDAADLVRAGLWDEDGDGWRFHDWLDYQPSSEEVEEKRRKERDKKRRQRSAGMSNRNADGTFIGRMSPGDTTRDSTRDTPGESPPDTPGESLRTRPDPTRRDTPQPPTAGPPDPDQPVGGEPPTPPDHHGQHDNCRACGTNRRGTKPPPEPSPTERTAQAAGAEMERNATRARGEACPTCDGAMWLDTDRGPDGYPLPPKPCPTCNEEARTA